MNVIFAHKFWIDISKTELCFSRIVTWGDQSLDSI